MMARAHAPYSKFHVGAAVRDEDGGIHGGCNVENAAYPQGLCAEAAAIAALVGAGGSACWSAPVIGPGPEVDHAVRRLPPEAARVRGRRPQDPSLRPRRAASHGDAGPAAADVVRPAPSRQAMIDVIAARAPGFKPKVARRPGLGPRQLRRRGEGRSRPSPMASCRIFRRPTVGSHAGRLVLGTCRRDAGRRAAGPRALLRARPRRRDEAGAIRAMAELGCETLLQTNAAGSLRLDMPPGSLMAITDHINFTGVNPLFGDGPATTASSTWSMPTIPRCEAAAGDREGGRRHVPRGHLYLVQRPELRDAGRDPRRARAGRRCRRHVDRAGDHPGAPCRHEGAWRCR